MITVKLNFQKNTEQKKIVRYQESVAAAVHYIKNNSGTKMSWSRGTTIKIFRYFSGGIAGVHGIISVIYSNTDI